MLEEGLDPVVVQPDRVEHAAGGFDGPGWGIAGARILGDSLRQDRTLRRELSVS